MYVAWVVCVQLCIGLTLSCRDRMNSIALPVLALLACSCGALQPTHERDDVAVRAWSAADVAEWVRSIGFPEYADVFEESAIDGRALLRMTLHTLRSELLIPSVEHSLAIKMELGELKHRRKLLSPMEATLHRVAHPTADEWSTAEVRDLKIPTAPLGPRPGKLYSPRSALGVADLSSTGNRGVQFAILHWILMCSVTQ